MPKQMVDLRIKEVSGVDRAANGEVGWLVMKSKFTPDQVAMLEQASALAKGTDPNHVSPGGSTMPFDREELAKSHPEAASYLAGLEAALVSKGAPAPAATLPTEEEVLAKSLENLPEPVRKALHDAQRKATFAQEEVRKMESRRELEGYTSFAKSLDALPDVTEKDAEIFQKAANGDATAVATILDRLAKANAVVKASAAFSEIGSSRVEEDSPEGRFTSVVKSLQDAEPTLAYEDVVTKAASQNPALYREYRAASLNTRTV